MLCFTKAQPQSHVRPWFAFYYLLLGSILCTLTVSPAQAHVFWTRVNQPSPQALGVYHFANAPVTPGSILAVASGLPVNRGLTIQIAQAAGLEITNDTHGPIFDPAAIATHSAQLAESEATLENLTGDLTVEYWFKWDANLTSQSLVIGLSSGAKLAIARDTANPANDRFGVQLVHGDYASAPGFVSWPAVGIEEAPLGEWLHAALTIHSAGMYEDPVLNHSAYTTGTLARFWLNGHAVGVTTHTVSLARLRAHDESALRVQSLAGAAKVDEVAIWSKDWSANGTLADPFANGRGEGIVASAQAWRRYP